ncbi:Phosphoglycerol transferase MdoB [Chitinophaga sp. CF118]|uniref:LTA synthase family protein n=1 Tax=Chitinophaga sp. CF118 TaxID=1884367 RepID=UPI0008EF5BFA|nr:alkaline phosphatase family protein [Chitinophaga sp. CF118]SFE15275.1 Phosphoglycerol transferase MdoB [Chitinophaga sp. CF118]
MKYSWKNIPRYIRYVILQASFLFIFSVLFRLVFYLFFFKTTVTGSEPVIKAWNLGLKFDLRLTLVLMVPVLLIALIWRNGFFTKPFLRWIVFTYLFIVYFVLVLLYVLDLGHYAYLSLRIDPNISRFMLSGERADNAKMLWESYPVVRAFIGLVLFLFLVIRLLIVPFRKLATQAAVKISRWRFTAWVSVMVLFFAAGIYGNVAYFPLRWSQAMFNRDNGITSLALNPILYLVSNLSVKSDTYDLKKTQEYYPIMANYLRVDQPDVQKLKFVRELPSVPEKPKMNVVLVMLESTGACVTSMFNNPMQATPNMQRLSDSGILFRRFFVPAISTARTVYGVTTGLPDIAMANTASRHPNMVDQRVIMDQFTGYEKYYLLGGNTNWANIRAVFTNNVEGVKIYEEGMYKAPKSDVWGISDYDLVTEADEVFRNASQRKQPFVAFLQLADNHPPFTTTEGAGDFKKLTEKDIDKDKFQKAGFISIDQFNALRYEDYNVGHLIDLAKKGGYLENTIFIMFGDHNCSLNPYHFMPTPEYELASGGVHATCFIYSPGNVKPQVINHTVSLVDVYPTMATMVGMPVKNYTLGQDMLDSSHTGRYAFSTFVKNLQTCIAVIGDRYQYEINVQTQETALYDLQGDPLKNVKQQQPDTAKALDNLTRAFYESTRYLMFNNKK